MGSTGAAKDDSDEMKALMARVRVGDVQAFQALYERFKGPLMSYVHSYVRDVELTEDLVQEVFMKVYRTRETYEPTARVSTWLWTIARNTCIDALRKASNREQPAEDPETGIDFEQLEAPLSNAEAQLMENADTRRLENCMGKLSNPQREALLLRTVSELSYEEIASALSTSLSAIKSLIFRAKEALIACLKKGALDGC